MNVHVFEHKHRKNPHGINRIPVRNEGCRSPSAELVRTIQHHRHPLINAVVISMFAKLEVFHSSRCFARGGQKDK